jgi:hypothetical protein
MIKSLHEKTMPEAEGAGGIGQVEARAIAATTTRPSTVRRLQRLNALIDELSARDMDAAAVALFLDCSATSARNYLNDLLEASVIRSRRTALSGDCYMRNGYHLNGDPRMARHFLAGCRESQCGDPILKRGRKQSNAARTYGTRHFHIMADDCCAGVRATRVEVRRDPLVAALFGENPPSKVAAA